MISRDFEAHGQRIALLSLLCLVGCDFFSSKSIAPGYFIYTGEGRRALTSDGPTLVEAVDSIAVQQGFIFTKNVEGGYYHAVLIVSSENEAPEDYVTPPLNENEFRNYLALHFLRYPFFRKL